MSAWVLVIVFVVAGAVGYRVIRGVPPMLHTPLMSGMNALSGVTVLGALVATAAALTSGSKALGGLAIILATTNVAGGFLVTHKMLRMFKRK